MDMQKNADLQRHDFEKEIEKLRQEQTDVLRMMKSQPLGGTLGPAATRTAGGGLPTSSHQLRSEYPDRSKDTEPPQHVPTSDADDEDEEARSFHPPGLLPGGGGPPPDGDDDDSDDNDQRKRDKKKKKKGKKKKKSSRGRSRRQRRDPSSSPSSSSSSRSSSSSESSFARKARKAVMKSQSSNTKAKEPDRVLVPKFPQPQNFRIWMRIMRVRDAVIAASSKPD